MAITYKNAKTYLMYKVPSQGTYVFMMNKNNQQFEYYLYDDYKVKKWHKKGIGYVKEWKNDDFIWSELEETYDFWPDELIRAIFEKEILQ